MCFVALKVVFACFFDRPPTTDIEDITYPCVDMNFIFEWSTRYLTSERSKRVRYRVEHENIKFISISVYVIFCSLYKHQWITKWAFPRKLHIFTCEDTCYLHTWRDHRRYGYINKSRLWKQADLVFHWCLYNKQNITYSLMDMNFIFSCSTRYRVDHSKIKFISTRGHVIFSVYLFR